MSRTLVDVRPAINGQVHIGKNAPEQPTINLGPHDIFAVFRRAVDFKGLIDEEIVVRSSIEGFQETTVRIKMEVHHKFFFHTFRLDTFPIMVKKSGRRFEEVIWFNFTWNGQEMGRIPIEIDLQIETEGYGIKNKK